MLLRIFDIRNDSFFPDWVLRMNYVSGKLTLIVFAEIY